MSKSISVPNNIQYRDVLKNDFSLSILDYKRFNFINSNKLFLKEICKIEQGTFIDNIDRTSHNTGLAYITIRDFDGVVSSNCFDNYIIPKYQYKNLLIEKNTILVSDAGSIGKTTFISESIKGINADGITRLNYLENKDIDIFYIFGCLQHEYFSQLLKTIAPSGSTQQNVEIKHFQAAFIPIPNKNPISTKKYISLITQSLINKEKLIKQRHQDIFKIIETELLENQKPNKFAFELPKIKEIEELGRLDTGIYSNNFKQIKFWVENYKGGYFFIDAHKIRSGSTPDVRYIGILKDLKYRWVTPTHCSDYGTLTEERINIQGRSNIREDCILLINRTSKGGIGEYVGIAGFYNFEDFGEGHHNQGMYRVANYHKYKLLYILCFLNCSLMRKYCSGLSVGSKMKELKTVQFLQIPIPNFSEPKQQEIAKLYHNSEIHYNSKTFTLENFLVKDDEYNEQAGIYELDKTAKQLREILNTAIESIVNDQEVKMTFDAQT